MATRAGATSAERLIAFAGAPAPPVLERTGALIAKNAAETIRKVWMFLVFMRTPFSNCPVVVKRRGRRHVCQTLLTGAVLDRHFDGGSASL
jgi:hypothetical protein